MFDEANIFNGYSTKPFILPKSAKSSSKTNSSKNIY